LSSRSALSAMLRILNHKAPVSIAPPVPARLLIIGGRWQTSLAARHCRRLIFTRNYLPAC
jgi:hypothetical protein